MKKYFFLLSSFIFSGFSAQETTAPETPAKKDVIKMTVPENPDKMNIIKTNVTAYVFRNINLSYERALTNGFL
jgi:hypothetical protein